MALVFSAFILLIFTAIKISGNGNFSTSFNFSLATGGQKKIYEKNFVSQEKALFVYPGILPNHPLYWTKMIRDRVKYYLIRKPEKRLNLLLEYADKRLVSGIILIEEDEIDLGISTITKGEKYLQKAAIYAKDNFNELENSQIYDKLIESYFKHRHELEKILISDLIDEKKQVVHRLQEYNNSLFESLYFEIIKESKQVNEIDLEQEASISGEVNKQR